MTADVKSLAAWHLRHQEEDAETSGVLDFAKAIRREALEEAAKLCEAMDAESNAAMCSFPPFASHCATAIRALKDKP